MTVDQDFLLVLKSNVLGDGEPDLGEKLLRSFLTVMSESDLYPAQIVCLNSGVFLTTEGSPVADLLDTFAGAGTRILSCGTCLDYFKIKDNLAVGKVGSMSTTVAGLTSTASVVTVG